MCWSFSGCCSFAFSLELRAALMRQSESYNVFISTVRVCVVLIKRLSFFSSPINHSTVIVLNVSYSSKWNYSSVITLPEQVMHRKTNVQSVDLKDKSQSYYIWTQFHFCFCSGSPASGGNLCEFHCGVPWCRSGDCIPAQQQHWQQVVVVSFTHLKDSLTFPELTGKRHTNILSQFSLFTSVQMSSLRA